MHNPYDFPTKYKLLTTQRNRYKVIQREGVINEKHCTDVLIRLHNDVFLQNEEEKLKKSNLEKNAPEAAFYLENKSSTANKKYFSRDKLRFEMSDMSSSHSRPLGYKDVECYIWRTKNDYLEFRG